MNSKERKITTNLTMSGLGLGTILSVVISYDLYKNVFWAFLHGLLGWIYVVFYLVFLK